MRKALPQQPKRFKLKRDENGHYYCIPVECEEEFDNLLYGDTPGIWNQFIEKFDDMRLNKNPCFLTFIDPVME